MSNVLRRGKRWVAGFAFVFLLTALVVFASDAFRQTRDLNNRLICGTRMKGFGTAVRIYSTESELSVDNALQSLHPHGDELNICPSSGKPFLLAPISDVDAIDGFPQTVVMYEPLSYHGGEGANILYGDGHASFANPQDYREAIAKSWSSGVWDVESNGQEPPKVNSD